MTYIITEVNGLEVVVSAFDGMAEMLEDDTEAMTRILDYGLEMAHLGFEMQGRFGAWEPIAVATLKRRKAMGISGEEALIRYGTTMDSFTLHSTEDAFEEVGISVARWGNTREDFKFHDHDYGHEPRRQVLGHLVEDVEKYKKIYHDWIMESFINKQGGPK